MKGKHLNISSEKVFDIVNNLLLVLIAVIIVVPLWNIVISSFSSGSVIYANDEKLTELKKKDDNQPPTSGGAGTAPLSEPEEIPEGVKTAKFYLFDVGLTRNLSGIDVPSDNQSDYGRLFENFIAMELKAWLDYSGSREELTFWRTERGTREVDFLIGDRIAIEVKSARRIKSSHLTGLHAIMEEKQFEKLIVVCREDIPYRTDEGIHILPWRFFLDKLWGGFLNHQ